MLHNPGQLRPIAASCFKPTANFIRMTALFFMAEGI